MCHVRAAADMHMHVLSCRQSCSSWACASFALAHANNSSDTCSRGNASAEAMVGHKPFRCATSCQGAVANMQFPGWAQPLGSQFVAARPACFSNRSEQCVPQKAAA